MNLGLCGGILTLCGHRDIVHGSVAVKGRRKPTVVHSRKDEFRIDLVVKGDPICPRHFVFLTIE